MSRRTWFPRDCGFTADPKVERLGSRFGPAGPLAAEELLALAKLEDGDGTVTFEYAQLARRAFLKSSTQAREIVDVAADVDLIQIVSTDKWTVTVSVVRWSRWQDPGAAERQAKKRAQDKASREGHAEVTPKITPATGDNHAAQLTVDREQRTTTPPDPPSGGTAPPRPSGGRGRELEAWEQSSKAWAAANFPGVEWGLVNHAISMLTVPASVENVRPLVERYSREVA